MKEPRIIAFANHKGGVGKTTTTVNVGTILADRGNKVLVIDMDAQSNLTTSLTHNGSDGSASIYYALTQKAPGLPVVSVRKGLDLVPSSLQLAVAELEMTSAINRERILTRLIEPIKERYDYILIDCPPSLGLLTMNAITASNEVIVPLVAEVLPFKGLTMINNFIDMVRVNINPKAHLSGILITRWESTNLTRQIEAGLRKQSDHPVFQTKIRKNISAAEAPLQCQSVVEYAPKSNSSQDYQMFVDELLLLLK